MAVKRLTKLALFKGKHLSFISSLHSVSTVRLARSYISHTSEYPTCPRALIGYSSSGGRIPVSSYSGIATTEHTEYQLPKEQTLCYSENRIADVTKIEAMRPRKSGYAIFSPKDGRKLPRLPAILSIPNKLLFRQLCPR